MTENRKYTPGDPLTLVMTGPGDLSEMGRAFEEAEPSAVWSLAPDGSLIIRIPAGLTAETIARVIEVAKQRGVE
jgi:hypothetical protein